MLGQPALPHGCKAAGMPLAKVWAGGGAGVSALEPPASQSLQRGAVGSLLEMMMVQRLVFRWVVQLPTVMQLPERSLVLYMVCRAWKLLRIKARVAAALQSPRPAKLCSQQGCGHGGGVPLGGGTPFPGMAQQPVLGAKASASGGRCAHAAAGAEAWMAQHSPAELGGCGSAPSQAKGLRKGLLKHCFPTLMASLITHSADGDAQ